MEIRPKMTSATKFASTKWSLENWSICFHFFQGVQHRLEHVSKRLQTMVSSWGIFMLYVKCRWGYINAFPITQCKVYLPSFTTNMKPFMSVNTLPETKKFALDRLRRAPKKDGIFVFQSHPFSGAMAVSFKEGIPVCHTLGVYLEDHPSQ